MVAVTLLAAAALADAVLVGAPGLDSFATR